MKRFARLLLTPIVCLSVSLISVQAANAQRDLKDIPPPDPELERSTFVVPEGFEVTLYASDPKIAKPIHMNFDAQGRLWIASSEVYPHIKPGQEAADKILVIDDQDRDGVADKTTVFADGLLIPTGVLPDHQGGAYVVNSTELLHLQDTDGDGAADRRRIALSGFGAEDTHHLLHSLRWGHDGALYMNQSIYIHSHIETPRGVKRLNGGGIWRYKPEQHQLDVYCRGFVNSWGHHTDRWGQSFATDGAYGEGINYVFPGAVFVTAVGAKRRLEGLNPGSPKHCGLEILSGRHLPEDWRGTMVTNDFRAHRVCRFVVTEDGAGYASRQAVEVIKSSHVAFRPIDVKMGPDGAIYIADWYNPIIQHGEVDFRDPRRDHVHGRIWRVAAKNRPLVERTAWDQLSIPQMLDKLAAPEDWTRLHAKLLLRARGADAVLPHLAKWLESIEGDDEAANHQRLEALWLHEAMNEPNAPLLDRLLRSTDHRVRAAAIRVATYWQPRLPSLLETFAAAARDEHPRVRLEAVRALANIPDARAASAALAVLDQQMDRFLDFALWQCMRDLQPHWLPLAQDGRFDYGGKIERLTFALKAADSPDVASPLVKLLRGTKLSDERRVEVLRLIGSLGSPNEVSRAVEWLLDVEASDTQRATWLQTLVDTTHPRGVRPNESFDEIGEWLASDQTALRAAVFRAIGAWRSTALRKPLVAAASDSDPSIRGAVYESLADFGDADAGNTLAKMASDSQWLVKRQAIASLARFQPKRAAQRIAAAIPAAPSEAELTELLRPILQRKGGPAALAAELRDVELPADNAKLAVRTVRQLASGQQQLVDALNKAGKLSDAGWKLTPKLSRSLVAEVRQHGDPHRGEQVFRQAQLQCLKCHGVGGSGGKVGPDLISIGASAQVDYLIESLLDPNAKIKENYHSIIVQTDEGKVLTGVPVRETEQQLVIRDAEDREVAIEVESIEGRREGRSLMPAGLLDSLTRDELRDLTAFLSQLGKVGDFAVSKTPQIRTWRVLLPTPDAMHRIRRTSFDTAATNDPAFQWQPAYSRVDGGLPIEELPHFNAPTYVTRKDSVKTVFLRARLEVTQPGDVVLDLGDSTGLQLWINGKPRPVEKQVTLALDRGAHELTLAVDQIRRREKPLRVELAPAKTTASVQLINGK